MVTVSAVALAVGLLALLSWVAASVIGTSVEGWSWLDPETRFGAAGRSVVAGLVGFGMGGLSASYAGWSQLAALAAALLGAGGAWAVAHFLGPSAAGRETE